MQYWNYDILVVAYALVYSSQCKLLIYLMWNSHGIYYVIIILHCLLINLSIHDVSNFTFIKYLFVKDCQRLQLIATCSIQVNCAYKASRLFLQTACLFSSTWAHGLHERGWLCEGILYIITRYSHKLLYQMIINAITV